MPSGPNVLGAPASCCQEEAPEEACLQRRRRGGGGTPKALVEKRGERLLPALPLAEQPGGPSAEQSGADSQSAARLRAARERALDRTGRAG